MKQPLPSVPIGFTVTDCRSAGFKRMWEASGTRYPWIGPSRKSERSAIHDAIREAAKPRNESKVNP